MSLNSNLQEELSLQKFTTLEDVQESGYDLTSYCKSCDKYKVLNIENWIQKLGRAFPVCFINSRANFPDILQCSLDITICLQKKITKKNSVP